MARIKMFCFILILVLVFISLLSACAPAATTQSPASSTSTTVTGSVTTTGTSITTTAAPTSSSAEPAKPQGELVVALPGFDLEDFLPWHFGLSSTQMGMLMYDLLIYWNEVDRKFIPGLAESWEVAPDAMTLTYHLRKGIQFNEGWGELTSADVKYNFEMQASTWSTGKVSQTRRIESMETPDPYTLIVHFKSPYPSFYMDLSLGNSGICQGIVPKKYLETVGEDGAMTKPIGSGPYRLIEGVSGEYFKFEAVDTHWRIVPEFKFITLRNVPETSTAVAMLKTKELDMAAVPAEQMADLMASGLSAEASPVGGGLIAVRWGGMVIPEDKRYDPTYHNKDPWIDPKVRQAMMISIDREAICKAIYAGSATPAAVPLFTLELNKYQYPYDPDTAKQLLKDAGYPNGFSFKIMSFAQQGAPEMPRVVEAMAGYWQQIGLDAKINIVDQIAYNGKFLQQCKTAGEISLHNITSGADPLDKATLHLMPGGQSIVYQDEASYAIYQEGFSTISFEEHQAYGEKLNQYYFENYIGVIAKTSFCYAWNPDKIAPFPHAQTNAPYYLDYVRHAKPLNTFRLFTPWPGR